MAGDLREKATKSKPQMQKKVDWGIN